MRFCFLSPTLGPSGGVVVSLMHAETLAQAGHEVDVIYPVILPNVNGWRFRTIPRIMKFLAWIPLNLAKYNRKKYQKMFPHVRYKMQATLSKLPEGYDAYVATWWETAYYLHEQQQRLGNRHFYFVQGYEPNYEDWGSDRDTVKSTYAYADWRYLTICRYLEKRIREDGAKDITIIYNDIPEGVFIRESAEKSLKSCSVGVIYRDNFSKGFSNFVDYMECDRHEDVKHYCIGRDIPRDIACRFDRVFDGGRKGAMKDFYNTVGLVVVPSLEEGFALPVIEAMMCGTPVAISRIGIAYELIEDGINGIIMSDNSGKSIAAAIERYCAMTDTDRLRMADFAYNTATVHYKEMIRDNQERILAFYNS